MEMLKRFIQYYKPHKKLFIFDMCCAFVISCCELIYPFIAKNIINIYVPNRQLKMLLASGALMLFVYIVKATLNYCVQYYGHIMGVYIQSDMRRDVFNKLQRIPFSYFDENKTGTIMSRIMNDLMDVSELAHHGPENVFMSSFVIIGAFILLCTISVPLTLITFVVLPLVVFFAIKMRKKMAQAFKETRVKIAEVNANLENSISGIRVSRSYTCAEHEAEKFNGFNRLFVKARSEAYRYMGLFGSTMTFSMDFLYLLVLVSGGLFFFYGKINSGEFTAYLLSVNMFLTPIRKLIDFFEQLQNGATGFERFCEIMDQPEEEEKADAIDCKELQGKIDFNHISFSYITNDDGVEEETPVISDLSLHIQKGTTVALVGPSGGGKTTLCHLLPRFYELKSGKITIDDIDITEMTRLSLRKNIGLVSQDVFLFTGTIRDNIAYGNLDADMDAIIDAAKKANIHDYIMTLPQGYDTYIGEQGVRLSGGQKQRISIARVFLKDPSILILDEATSALDNATEMLIQQSLDKLMKGRTSVVVAHRLSTIKNADVIVVIDHKGIAEMGDHETLLKAGGIYATLYNYQFKDKINA